MSGVEVASKLRWVQVDRLLNELKRFGALCRWGSGFVMISCVSKISFFVQIVRNYFLL